MLGNKNLSNVNLEFDLLCTLKSYSVVTTHKMPLCRISDGIFTVSVHLFMSTYRVKITSGDNQIGFDSAEHIKHTGE